MLRRFHIRYFRSCKDVLLDRMGSLTALVGRNGSGKTIILRAIEWLARTASSAKSFMDSDEGLIDIPESMTADVEQNGVLYRYTFATRLEPPAPRDASPGSLLVMRESLALSKGDDRWDQLVEREGGDVRTVERSVPIHLDNYLPCLPALVALLPPGHDLLRHVRVVLSFFKATRYYPVDETNVVSGIDAHSVITGREYHQWRTRFDTMGDAGDSALMRLLYAYLEKKSQFNEIQALLGPDGLDLIETIRIESFRGSDEDEGERSRGENRRYFVVGFRPSGMVGKRSSLLQCSQLSLGTRRVLHILLSLIVDASPLMLIEHPEDGIHRGLVRKLIDLLDTNTDPGQIILSTHSGLVLNQLAPPNVRLVSIHRGRTQVRALDEKQIADATRFIEEQGSLADFIESVEE
jgi:ABC-type transport system involved in cytochrome c biogenesis ATPase subunit